MFWFGDLNYRINLPRSEAVSLAEAGQYATLYKADQLALEKDANRAFHGFLEPPPAFPPSYK